MYSKQYHIIVLQFLFYDHELHCILFTFFANNPLPFSQFSMLLSSAPMVRVADVITFVIVGPF